MWRIFDQQSVGKVQAKCREGVGKCSLECTKSVDKSVDKMQESVANVAHFLLAKCGKSVDKVQGRCREVQPRVYQKCGQKCRKSVAQSVSKVQSKVQTECSKCGAFFITKVQPTCGPISKSSSPLAFGVVFHLKFVAKLKNAKNAIQWTPKLTPLAHHGKLDQTDD